MPPLWLVNSCYPELPALPFPSIQIFLFSFFPDLSRSNWHTSLCMFKVYSMMIHNMCKMITTIGSVNSHLLIQIQWNEKKEDKQEKEFSPWWELLGFTLTFPYTMQQCELPSSCCTLHPCYLFVLYLDICTYFHLPPIPLPPSASGNHQSDLFYMSFFLLRCHIYVRTYSISLSLSCFT